MSDPLETLVQERRALADEIERSRHELTRAAARMRRPLQRIDRLRRDARFIRDNYGLLLLPVAVLVVLNPARTLKLGLAAFAAFRRFQRLDGAPAPRALQALIEGALLRRA